MNFLKILIAFLLLQVSLKVEAQWSRLQGPEDCYPTALIKVSNEILCGTAQGIYSTTDEGLTWNDYTNFPTKFITAMLNFTDTIVILYSSGKPEDMYYDSLFSTTSFDGGISWSSPNYLNSMNSATIHAYGNTIMAGLSDRLVLSNDFGITWKRILFPGQYFNYVNFFDKMYICGTTNPNFTIGYNYWGFGGDTTYHRFDSLNTMGRKVAIDTVLFGYQMNTGSYYDIIRSTDLANTWQPVATVNQSINFRLEVYDGLLYHMGNSYNVSSDMGNTWNPSSIPHRESYPIGIPISNGDELCSAQFGGLVHYVSSTDSSYPSYNGIRGSNISNIACNDSDIFVLNRGRIYKSHDWGSIWDTLTPYWNSNLLVIGDSIFCGGFIPWRSFDGGNTWTMLQNSPNISDITNSGSRIYGSWQDTYYSDDFGDNWTMLSSTTIQGNCSGYPGSGSMATLNNVLYSVTYDGTVSRYDTIGNGWVEVLCISLPPNSESPVLQKADNKLIVTSEHLMYISADGTNWNYALLNGIPTGTSGNKICPQSVVGFNGDLIGTCGKYGIFYTYNDGHDWFPFTPVTPFIANCLAIFNNQLYAGSFYQGVWASSVILDDNHSNKFNSRDINIYPNPANDYFNFELPENIIVNRLFIFDNLGKRIIDIPVEKGNRKINISVLNEGLYFMQWLNKDEAICNRKLLVLR